MCINVLIFSLILSSCVSADSVVHLSWEKTRGGPGMRKGNTGLRNWRRRMEEDAAAREGWLNVQGEGGKGRRGWRLSSKKVLAWEMWKLTTINKEGSAYQRSNGLLGNWNDKLRVPCCFLPEDVIIPFSFSKNWGGGGNTEFYLIQDSYNILLCLLFCI